MQNKRINLIYLFVGLIIFLSLLHLNYAIRTNNYFSVDDFQVLEYFKNHNVGNMIVDFFLRGDIFGYRKITGYIVFGELFKNFGLNQYYFIVTLFLIHTINLLTLFFIIRKITKNDFAAFVMSVVYNRYYLFYFSNIHELLGAFFVLISIYLFLKFPKRVYLSLAAYVLALFSKELTFAVPFFLLAISLIRKTEVKKTIPHFSVLLAYALYQSYFLFFAKSTTFIQSYGVSLNFANLYNGLLYYFNPYLLVFLVLLPLFTKKVKPVYVLIVCLTSLFPVLFFGSRRELYYLYIPAIYLFIYISMYLPKLSFKSALIYLAIPFLFGGRVVFPIIAKQDFPNWQKVSIDNVTLVIEKSLKENPSYKKIDLSQVNLERDADLMLRHNVVELFVDKSVSDNYHLVYNQEENSLTATRK